MRYTTDGSSAPAVMRIALGWSRIPVTENSVAIAVAKPFVDLMESITDISPLTLAQPPGIIHGTSGAGGPNWNGFDVGLIIPNPEVYLVISTSTSFGATPNTWGYVVVVEGVSPAALANFR